MDLSEISVLASYAGSGTALLLVASIGWIAFKTRSWHPIRYRLWLLVNGKSKVIDREVAKALQDETDLIAFRFHFMDVDSLYEAKKLIEWADAKHISLSMLQACDGYFSSKKLALKDKLPPLRPIAVVVAAIGGIGACIALFAMLGMATSSAIYRFKDSGQWFLLAPHEARALFVSHSSTLTDAACKASQDSAESSFTPEDKKALCQIFADPKFDTYVSDTVRQQRTALGFLLGAMLFCWTQIFGGLLRLRTAWRLKEHLEGEVAEGA